MAVTSGFYNSVSGDRKYNALQMSSIFDGIIEDGVYNSIGDRFSLIAGEGNTVIVGTGRAWFNHTWTLNDADYPLTIEPAEVVLNRYDAIVIEVNRSNAVRNNSIKVIKGTAGSSPSKPAMANGDDNIWQHPLGYIYVPAGSSSVSQSNIEYVVGTSECPFVVAAVQSVDIDALVAQWQDEFDTWFDNLEYQLSGDVAGNLQNQINQKVDKSDVIDNPDDLLANQAENMVAGAKAVVGVFSKLIFLDHFTVDQSPYTFECFVFRVNGIKTAVVFGSWSGTSSSYETLGSFSVYRITNLKLTPNDERVNAKRNISLKFRPLSGGSGLFFMGNYEGLKLQGTANEHFYSINYLYSLATNVPNRVKIGWTIIMECYE